MVASGPSLPDLGRVGVEDSHYIVASLAEPTILHERQSNTPRSDESDTPPPIETENFSEPPRKISDVVAQTPFSERSEQRKILPNLGGRGRAPARHLFAGYRLSMLTLQIF